MLQIEALEIDEYVLDKIETKHSITFQEAEEACLSDARHIRKSRDELYKVFSQTNSGRYILVVLVHLDGGIWKIVTARDMTGSERQLYKRR